MESYGFQNNPGPSLPKAKNHPFVFFAQSIKVHTMVKTRKPAKSAKDVYQKVDDLPEVKKKAYNSILEDFDRQGIYHLKL